MTRRTTGSPAPLQRGRHDPLARPAGRDTGMRVLIACEFSGVVRDAFRALGHDAWSCDRLPSETSGKHYQGDLRHFFSNPAAWGGFDLMIAHPPCTRLANSGVRWLHVPPKGKTLEQMWRQLEIDAEFYKWVRSLPIERKAIENPIMHKYAKRLVQPIDRKIIQPWHFGERAFKGTGFELINLPLLKETERLIPPKRGTQEHKDWSAVHRASPGPDRWKDRSRTFPRIAAAMAQQWGSL